LIVVDGKQKGRPSPFESLKFRNQRYINASFVAEFLAMYYLSPRMLYHVKHVGSRQDVKLPERFG
jgi:hypothetical protein